MDNLSQQPQVQNTKKFDQRIKAIVGILVVLLLALMAGMVTLVFTSVKTINEKDKEISTLKKDLNTVTATPTVIISPTSSAVVTTTPTPAPSIVKVFFPKDPASYSDFNISVSVNRQTSVTDQATFAIEQLILGPTSNEQIQGLFTPIKFSGVSNCGDRDFTVVIDPMKKATVKFCKLVTSAGIGTDALITVAINNTLKQFTNIEKVVILTSNNNCFGDMSGQDLCKK